MADPFEALRAPLVPADPDADFAARLRARIRAALDLGGAMPSTTSPAPITALNPYLAVVDARRALAWYVETLGARPRGEPIVMPDGRVGHAELDLAGNVLMVADEHPEIGVVGPRPGQGAAVTLHLTVADVDAVAATAVAAGADLERAPAGTPYGRNAVLRDPFGHRWMLSSQPAAGAGEDAGGVRPGDVVYVSLWVPDVERAAAFFAAVLGWRYAPGSGPQGRQVEGVTPNHGLWGSQERSTLFLCFAVDDVQTAVQRVRQAGGRAEDARSEPYGLAADCVDDQGLPFALVSGSEARAGGRPLDVAYITMEVVDAERAHAFYASVLGWRFTPGRTPGAWNVEEVRPMTGVAGGAVRPTVVPMYRVDDVAAAVERVRAAGGTAPEPERQPYGVTALCTDDQGTRFYLGEL